MQQPASQPQQPKQIVIARQKTPQPTQPSPIYMQQPTPQPQPQQPQQIVVAEQNAPQQPQPSPVYMQQPVSQPQPQQPKQIVIARQKTPQPTQPSPIYMQQPTPQPQPQQPQQIVIAEQNAPQQAQPSPVYMQQPAPQPQPQKPKQIVIARQGSPQPTQPLPVYMQHPKPQPQPQQPQQIVVAEQNAPEQPPPSPVFIQQPQPQPQQPQQIVIARQESPQPAQTSPVFIKRPAPQPLPRRIPPKQTVIARQGSPQKAQPSPLFMQQPAPQPQQTVIANQEAQPQEPSQQAPLYFQQPGTQPQQQPNQPYQEQPVPSQQYPQQFFPSQYFTPGQQIPQNFSPKFRYTQPQQIPARQLPFYRTQRPFNPYQSFPLPKSTAPQQNFPQSPQSPQSQLPSPDTDISSPGPDLENKNIDVVFDKLFNIYLAKDRQNDSFIITPRHLSPQRSPTTLSRATNASNKIAFLFYNILQKLLPNVFFSPINIMLIFTMLLRGSTGVTANQIYENLGFQAAGLRNLNDLQTACHSLLDNFDSRYNNVGDPRYQVEFSNGLFFKSSGKINSNFLNDMLRYFHSTPLGVEFKRGPRHSQRILNDWILSVTKGNEMSCEVGNEPIDPSTSLLAASVSFFSLEIDPKVIKARTSYQYFYNFGQFPILTKYLNATVNAKLITSTILNADIIECLLPSTDPNRQYTKIFIQSRDEFSIQQMKLTHETYNLVLNELWQSQPISVDVSLPMYILKQSLRLDRFAPIAGIETVFHPYRAELPYVSWFERLNVERIYHESYIDVFFTESPDSSDIYENSKSAATKFTINKPFFQILREEKTNTIFYIGHESFV
ncbi:hypothetical protein B4U79_16608 [Dinothrombium tinctorium]|uniref:Serpin domain-containing protein n=1 Tax=Dinothrombium tinctorium TaxID=1965070 RepID=A0A443QHP7_9ACAR|nr:hypothetical protein B4U79_16608 [Dinothrombium tinctorium]